MFEKQVAETLAKSGVERFKNFVKECLEHKEVFVFFGLLTLGVWFELHNLGVF